MLAVLIHSPTNVVSDDGDCGFRVDCYPAPAIYYVEDNKEDTIIPIPCDPLNDDCPPIPMYGEHDHEIVDAPSFVGKQDRIIIN